MLQPPRGDAGLAECAFVLFSPFSPLLKVIGRNERILVWPFPGSKISGDGVPEAAMDPPAELSEVCLLVYMYDYTSLAGRVFAILARLPSSPPVDKPISN